MCAHHPKALFIVVTLLSLSLVSCFGGHGGGGGGGNGGGGGGNGGGGGGSSQVPVLQIAVTHTGNFQQGQTNATYTVTVTNTGTAGTSGNVQVNVTIPAGETLVSSSGSGWSANGSVATRGDALAAGQSWPSITVTVNVAASATSPQVVTVSITGGGAQNANAQDSTTIINTVSFLFGRYAFFLSGFDVNGAVAIAGSINVDANGIVTGEEDFKDPTTLLTAASVVGNCQNFPVAASGFCNLTAGGKTSRYDFVLRNNFVVARLAEDPVDGANVGSGILISQQVPSPTALTTANGFNGFFSISFVGTDAVGARIAVEGNIFTNLGATIVPQGGIPSQADVNDNGTLISPVDSATTNVTGKMTGPVDPNGRATMTMTVGTSPASRSLTLALYILASQDSGSNQAGRAFAIDITALPNTQVLTGQLFWLGNNPSPLPFSNSSISGTNVFALWGVVPGSPGPPATAPSSNTIVGTITPSALPTQLLLDINSAGKVNGGGLAAPPLTGTVNGPINVASNGRAVLSTTVGSVTFTYVLYLDAVNDGSILETAGDTTVSFGFFTGQVPTSRFDNTHITGTYVTGTDSPVLSTVPNSVSPITLTPSSSSCSTTCNGTFAAGSTNGNYSFVPATGRGTALASSGQVFQNKNAVFYIITPGLMMVMGADQGVTSLMYRNCLY